MVELVRIGIVGCRSVIRGSYMPLVKKLAARGLVTVAVACDKDEAKRSAVREKLGIPNVTADFGGGRGLGPGRSGVGPDLNADARADYACRAGGGQHVLVEKPMAVTLPEAREVLELARRGPGCLVCAPHVVFGNTYQPCGALSRGQDRENPSRRVASTDGPVPTGPLVLRAGRRSLFDVGVYNVVALTGLLGPAKR